MNREPIDEKEAFNIARRLALPEERVAYLQQVCGHEPQALHRILELLNVYFQESSFLESPAVAPGATIDAPAETPGTVIGPYKLLEQIGEGGMGLVFMAEQSRPVRRRVALKIIKPGMDTRQIVARFEAERQALALMEHPNIAHVFDGGATDSGRPYFVMELVRGVPITEFCDQRRLPTRQRLELFVTVCQAVQHAHQKGIIHRDLKPSNVLVTLHDTVAVSKIIDFGIAKATTQPLTDQTLFTHFAQMIGTPSYMSPEQAEMNGLDVDTRSDVYALGVLLYELLTGTTPFESQTLNKVGLDEMRRMIREEEPPRPSQRLNTLAAQVCSTVSEQRGVGSRLGQALRGELDWIVMKALEKDRNRRYESASAFATDVQHYLADERVHACPPSAWYRLRKLARRNKMGLAVAGLMLSFLMSLGGLVGWVVRDHSARQAAIEQQVTRALDDAMELQGQGKWGEALEALKGAEAILGGSGSDEFRGRVEELRKEVEVVQRLEGIRLEAKSENVLDRDRAYAQAFQDYGIDLEALAALDAANLIRTRRISKQLTEALDAWIMLRGLNGHLFDQGSGQRLIAVAQVADPDEFRNRLREAGAARDRQLLERLAGSEKIKDQPVQTLSLLVTALNSGPAMAVLRVAREKYPDDFMINFQLGWVLNHAGQKEEAARYYSIAAALRPRNAAVHFWLGEVLRRLGRLDEAIAEYRKAIDLKPSDPETCNHLAWRLAACPWLRSRIPASAIDLASRAVELVPQQGNYWNTLGVARYRAGDWTGAVEALTKSMDLLKSKGESFNTFFLAMAHWQLGDEERAHGWFDRAVQWMETNDPKHEALRRFRSEAEEVLELKKK